MIRLLPVSSAYIAFKKKHLEVIEALPQATFYFREAWGVSCQS